MTEHHDTVDLTYARSLLELANEGNETEAVANEVDALGTLLDENPMFAKFLRDPGIGETERAEVIDKTFGDKLQPLVAKFVRLLNARGRIGRLPQIVAAFEYLLDEQLGKVECDVTVAEKLGDDELERVRRKVSEALKKDAVVHQYVDADIIGGMILRVGDKVVDASVRRQLAAMREKLLRGA